MQVHTDINNIRINNPVLTIGTFDGLHQGHRYVLDQLKKIAHRVNGETVILTFWPHPRQVIDPKNSTTLLNTIEEKTAIFEKQNIDHLLILEFTQNFAGLHYDEFIEKILVEKLGTKHLILGYDHRFGRKGSGTYETIKPLANDFGFQLHKLEEIRTDEKISSTKIRYCLQRGNITNAARLLGYPYMLSGRVVRGQQIGKTLGFPTANIEPVHPSKMIPGNGVYAVSVKTEKKQQYAGMLNIGTRPTVSDTDKKSIEVHLIDYQGDLYGKVVEVQFIEKLRDEKKFQSKQDLINQLHKDQKTAKKILKPK